MKMPMVMALVGLFLMSGFAPQVQAQDDEAGLKQQLVGQWMADAEKTLEHMKKKSDEMPDGMLEMMEQLLPQIGMTFNDDATFVMGGPQGDQSGNFSIDEVDTGKKMLAIKVSMEQVDGEKSAKVTFENKDAMKLETDEGDVLFFKRKKADSDSADSADKSDG